MVSKFTQHLIDVHDKAEHAALREMSSYADKAAKVAAAIDAELAEVRSVLEGLQTFQMNLGDVETEQHWCSSPAGCNVHCQRARTLWEKLKV